MVAVASGDGRFLVSEAVGAVVSDLDARSVLAGSAHCACTGAPRASRPAPDGALAAHLLVRRGAGPVLERWN